MKKVLIFACNNVPTPSSQQVEGTGLRYWRMALALKTAGLGDVTVAVLKQFTPKEAKYKGINIVAFDMESTDMGEFLKGYDTAVYSYGYGPLPDKIAESAPDSIQLIADAYSPYYVEALMRAGNSSDKLTAKFYDDQVFRCNRAIASADYVLYSGEDQRRFYEGLLAGIGVLSKFTNRLIELPAYVEKVEGPQLYQIPTDKLRLTWFGGMYPWFDASSLVDIFADNSISSIATLTVVGGYNPAYPRSDKRHNQQFDEFYKKAKDKKLIGNSIHFMDWVGYDERLEIFSNTDLAIMVNNVGIETKYSFRIRLADLAGNCVPVVTNGGDPLSDYLISIGAAFKSNFSNAKVDIAQLKKLLEDRASIIKARDTLGSVRISNSLHIESYTNDIAKKINEGTKPRLKDKFSSWRVRELSPGNIAYLNQVIEGLSETKLKFDKNLADLSIKNLRAESEISDLKLQLVKYKRLLRDPVYFFKLAYKKLTK